MKNIFKYCLIGLFAVVFISTNTAVNSAESETIAIIVSKTSKLQKLDVGELSLIYLRKKLYSSEGKRIIPINLPSSHGIRKQFSSLILGGAPETHAEYWNEMYYHGITPPHVVGSEDAAIKFVEITPGAIAYINACKLTEEVKAIAWVAVDGSLLQQPPNLNCPQ